MIYFCRKKRTRSIRLSGNPHVRFTCLGATLKTWSRDSGTPRATRCPVGNEPRWAARDGRHGDCADVVSVKPGGVPNQKHLKHKVSFFWECRKALLCTRAQNNCHMFCLKSGSNGTGWICGVDTWESGQTMKSDGMGLSGISGWIQLCYVLWYSPGMAPSRWIGFRVAFACS